MINEFGIHVEEGQDDGVGDLLVPEGLQSVKFVAHSGEPGVRLNCFYVVDNYSQSSIRLRIFQRMEIHCGLQLGRAARTWFLRVRS